MRQSLYVLVGLLAGILLAGVLFVVSRQPGGTPVALEAPPTKVPIEVHVIGAVLRPGVYIFSEGSRVQDAVSAAGGFSSEADLGAMNLAAKLEDGEQLDVPFVGGSPSTALPAPGFRVVPAATATASGDQININTATVEQLETLPGIGPSIAQNIVDYRLAHGPFAHIEDIMNVAGIGPATFDNIKDLITQ